MTTPHRKTNLVPHTYFKWRKSIKEADVDYKLILEILREKRKISEVAQEIIKEYNLEEYL